METPSLLQARGREAAIVRLSGTRKGTPPVIIRHKQSLPLLIRDLSASQQSEVGEPPPPPPAVAKLMQGVKLLSMDDVHNEVIWP